MGAENVGTVALKAKSRAQAVTAPSPNAFAGKAKSPTQKELQSALGPSSTLWNCLVAGLTRDLALDGEDWHSSSAKHGWALRLQKKKRNIVYLGPRSGSFIAAFALGDKAVAVAKQSALPANVLKLIANAKRYAEGTAVRIPVDTPEDVEVVKVLARIKTEN
jgi:hypothetical protein